MLSLYKNLINKRVQIYRGNLKGVTGKVIKQVNNKIYIEKVKMYVRQKKTQSDPTVRYLYIDISNVGVLDSNSKSVTKISKTNLKRCGRHQDVYIKKKSEKLNVRNRHRRK